MHTHQIESIRPSFSNDSAFVVALGVPSAEGNGENKMKAALPGADLTEHEPEQHGVPYSPLND